MKFFLCLIYSDNIPENRVARESERSLKTTDFLWLTYLFKIHVDVATKENFLFKTNPMNPMK